MYFMIALTTIVIMSCISYNIGLLRGKIKARGDN